MAKKYLKPAFFIIGERKCGTSSLYRYLIAHPQIIPCKIKEPQFFSRPWLYRKLFWWRYRALFPAMASNEPASLQWYVLDDDGTLRETHIRVERCTSKPEITGEASANMLSQVPPQRLHAAFPQAKLIAVLREPVRRAFAHYRMLQRFKREGRRLPFEMTNFTADVKKEIQAIQSNGSSYFVAPGMYVENLRPWMDLFGDQLQVVRTEDLQFYRKGKKVLADIYAFLGIDPRELEPSQFVHYNVSSESHIPDEARHILQLFYEPYNRALERLLGRKMKWDE